MSNTFTGTPCSYRTNQSTTAVNPNFIPPASKKPEPYRIETLAVKDGDIIILHLAKDLDFNEMSMIQKDIQQYFPNNQVICANEHILESITVLHKENNPFIDLNNLGWSDLVHK